MGRSGEVRSRVIQGCWQPETPLQKDSLVLPELFPHDFILRQALLGSYFLMGPSPSCMEQNGLRAHPRVAMPGQTGSVYCPGQRAWFTTHRPAEGPVQATCTTAGRSCTGLWAPHLSDFCFSQKQISGHSSPVHEVRECPASAAIFIYTAWDSSHIYHSRSSFLSLGQASELPHPLWAPTDRKGCRERSLHRGLQKVIRVGRNYGCSEQGLMNPTGNNYDLSLHELQFAGQDLRTAHTADKEKKETH